MKNKGGRQVPNCVPESVNEDTSKKDIEKLTSYKDLSKFIKANKSKINSKDFNYIEDEVESLKYLESDYKRGKADRQEVEVAVIDAQDSIKRAMSIKVESVNEETASEIIKDLDKVKNDLLKKVDTLVVKKKKLYSNVDIESPMSADEKKLDKEIADLFSQINQLVLQKRSLKKESVNEGLYFVGYNKGRGQGIGVFKDSYSSYKDAKKAVEKLEKERGGSYNMTAYYVADKDGKFVRESVVKEISSRTPKIFVKTAAVEKKIKELMADRKKAVVPYNNEKDPKKKEILKQILIKLTQQIQGYEKNLIQLRDMEEEYLQQMHANAELDTSAFD